MTQVMPVTPLSARPQEASSSARRPLRRGDETVGLLLGWNGKGEDKIKITAEGSNVFVQGRALKNAGSWAVPARMHLMGAAMVLRVMTGKIRAGVKPI